MKSRAKSTLIFVALVVALIALLAVPEGGDVSYLYADF
jgi:hypothetical protein